MPGQSTGQYSIVRHFDAGSGLPQSSVLDLAMDSCEFLWITTESGLVRSDGHHFRSFTPPGPEMPRSARMRRFFHVADGSLYADDATDQLFAIEKHQQLVQVARKHGNFRINGVVPNRALLLRILTAPDSIERYDQWRRSGPVFIGSYDADWFVVRGDRIYRYHGNALMEEIQLPSHTMASMQAGRMVYSLTPAGMVHRTDLVDNSITSWNVRGLPSIEGSVRSLPTNVHWQPGMNGLHIVLDGKLYRIFMDGADGPVAEKVVIDLPGDSRVTAVHLIGNDDIYAIGTSTNGLYLYSRKLFHELDWEAQPNDAHAMYAQTVVQDSSIWGVDIAARIWRYGPHDRVPVQVFDERVNRYTLSTDRSGSVWALARMDLLRISHSTLTSVQYDSSAIGASMLFAEGDSLWMINSTGLSYVKDGVWHRIIDMQDGPQLEYTSQILRDRQGRLLIASCHGLLRSSDRTGREFSLVPGTNDICVRVVLDLNCGELIGTYGKGLFLMANGELKPLEPDRYGALRNINALVLDPDSGIWISTNQGLLKTRHQDLVHWLRDPQDIPFYAYYGKHSGIGNIEFNGGCSPAAVTHPEGYIFLPSMGGPVWFHPRELKDPFPVRPLLVENIRLDGRPVGPSTSVLMDHDVTELSFDVALPYWGEPRNAQMEYRIPGIVEEWSAISEVTQRVSIVRPPSGKFMIQLRIAGAASRSLARTVQVPLTIRAPWYRSWIVYVLSFLALGSLVAGIIRINAKRLEERNSALEAGIRARTQELAGANSELRKVVAARNTMISIITHEVATPLRFAARVARSTYAMYRQDPLDPEIDPTLKDLTTSAEKLHGNVHDLLGWAKLHQRSISVVIAPVDLRHAIANAVDLVREIADAKNVVIHENIAPGNEVDTDRHVLSIVLNNIITNAVNHLSNAEVSIYSERIDQECRIHIRDTGQGIPPQRLERIRKHFEQEEISASDRLPLEDGEGLGFVIVSEMVRLLNGHIELDSGDAGTHITLHLRDQ